MMMTRRRVQEKQHLVHACTRKKKRPSCVGNCILSFALWGRTPRQCDFSWWSVSASSLPTTFPKGEPAICCQRQRQSAVERRSL